MTEKKVTASDRRYAAISALQEKYRPESNGYRLLPNVTREEVARDIAELAKLGRTEKWKGVIEQWERMVLDGRDDFEMMVVRGEIFAYQNA